MDDQTITCPSCQTVIPLTQAITASLRTQISREEQKKLEVREIEIRKKVLEESKIQLEELTEENKRKDERIKEAQKLEIGLRKEKLLLEEQKKAFEVELARAMDKERASIKEKALLEASETHRLKEKEKDMVIEQLRKSLEDAQRKATQGSQQMQGEVMELDLEELLRTTFPTDSIEPIAKGVSGADIRQIVKSTHGTECGTILWEIKRTKVWTDGWIPKLKEDLRAEHANIPAIISEALPPEAKNGMGLKDGVWVTSHQLIVPLATLLRKVLHDATYQKKVAQNRDDKSQVLYNYITSHEFQQQIETLREVYMDMNEQITKERLVFEKIWKQKETQIRRLLTTTAGLYGTMQGIVGNALPEVKGMELMIAVNTLEDAQKENKKLTGQENLI